MDLTQAIAWAVGNKLQAACIVAGVAVVGAPGLASAPLLAMAGVTPAGIQAATRVVVVTTIGVIICVSPGLVTGPILATLGFAPGGIKAVSTAALIHSGIGNIAAGSLMAISQSAGAGGAGLAVLNTAVQVVGGMTAVGVIVGVCHV
ncbi:hypothetical protein N7466_001729 [Penicillium verhagenii]|uniref:uncharacterized protein n=1 Tax=Penicillium verhagenii TaxID=1562060 RepID=UPI0025459080|nr:uncharacterized protein N7466_001729 [Penicillium verhagenii]KAJ5938595.1 hypothetical protein N7466_001729 [Penicillium verhagenii]